ncbi:nuclear transport factor 2 family protein [Nocardia vinacea]|uniref:nuclear transport factor 2 family protein n=1 Tax=Nocardia vinacea TaxID=96468 RepID=UPI000318F95E|nr:nuclear transport factor 2 family protein [Nocardia vinacea]
MSTTSRETIERLLSLTAGGPTPEMADVYAVDAVFELPFLPPGAEQPEVGREAFRTHLLEGARIQRFDSVDNVRIHETADPEVVISEYRINGTVLATGKRFDLAIINVSRVRDGLIVSTRSYSNPLAGAIAFDQVDALLGGLVAEQSAG